MSERYLATIQNQKPKTVRRKRDIAARLRSDFPGGVDVPISKVAFSTVAAWLASYSSRAPSYNLYLEYIRAVFRLAVEDKVLASSQIEGLKSKRASKSIRKTPTFEEFQSIVASIRGQPFSAEAKDSGDFVEFIGLAGLGQAEANALTWVDVEFPRGQIAVLRMKTGQGFQIPIYPQLRPLLERIKQERGADCGPTDRVFKVKDAKKAISAACKRLGLPAYTHRSFRRLFITRAIERGVDVKVISQWQGHRDGGKLILDTYSHVAPKHSERMAKLMGSETEN